jgi:Sigma-70, region 4
MRDPAGGLPLLTPRMAARVVGAYRSLPRRSRYVLTARLGLLGDEQTLKETAKPLALHLSRVRDLQVLALDALCQAAAREGRARPNPMDLLNGVEATLRALAVVP